MKKSIPFLCLFCFVLFTAKLSIAFQGNTSSLNEGGCSLYYIGPNTGDIVLTDTLRSISIYAYLNGEECSNIPAFIDVYKDGMLVYQGNSSYRILIPGQYLIYAPFEPTFNRVYEVSSEEYVEPLPINLISNTVSNNTLHLDITKSNAGITLSLFSLDGSFILEQAIPVNSLGNYAITLPNLPEGIYLVQIRNSKTRLTERVYIQ